MRSHRPNQPAKMRSLVTVLALILVLAGGSAASAGPTERAVEATIKTYFLAWQRGDLAALKKISFGRARAGLNRGRREIEVSRLAARGFKSVSGVRAAGNKAMAVAHFDPQILASKWYPAWVRARLSRLRDAQRRKTLAGRAAAMKSAVVALMTRQRVFLVRIGGRWKVSGVRPEGLRSR